VVDYRRQRGFVLIATCIALVILMAVAALGIDLGRMYLIRSELQSFADAAALSAALRLDGTDQGLASARTAPAALTAGPNAMKWNMGTEPITDIAMTFAKGDDVAATTTWETSPKNPAECRLVRVVASAKAPLTFLRVFEPFKADVQLVAAAGVAMKTDQSARLME